MLCPPTNQDVDADEYVGPGGFKNLRGAPKIQSSSDQSYDEENSAKSLGRLSGTYGGLVQPLEPETS